MRSNIIACQMNLIEYGVMLDLNLKGYTFFDTHWIQKTKRFSPCWMICGLNPLSMSSNMATMT